MQQLTAIYYRIAISCLYTQAQKRIHGMHMYKALVQKAIISTFDCFPLPGVESFTVASEQLIFVFSSFSMPVFTTSPEK